MGEMVFFDIPVYRCTYDKHTEEMKTEKGEFIKSIENKGISRQEAPITYRNAENYFDRNKWYSWRYNDIIGWIRLFLCGKGIRGEYWWVSSKRIIKRGKKEFAYCGKSFESNDITSENSEQIYHLICELISQISKERPFKNRYIDMELLGTLGPFINWRGLIDTLNF